jgi:endonuclease YncB( thermonuclease family)
MGDHAKYDFRTRRYVPFPRRRKPIWRAVTRYQAIKMAIPLAILSLLLVAAVIDQYSRDAAPTQQYIEIIDGDTVRSGGNLYRLIGFDTPESGTNARCERERALADRATKRLRQLLASGEPNLQRLSCACPWGTEGTQECNYSRRCGRLTVDGNDVGVILIREGLARPRHCLQHSCQPRPDWCR